MLLFQKHLCRRFVVSPAIFVKTKVLISFFVGKCKFLAPSMNFPFYATGLIITLIVGDFLLRVHPSPACCVIGPYSFEQFYRCLPGSWQKREGKSFEHYLTTAMFPGEFEQSKAISLTLGRQNRHYSKS